MALAACAGAQSPAPTGADIRVNVNLIQIDLTVINKQGQRVPDLTAADFEVLQNGKKQKITNLLWVGRRSAGRPAPDPAAPAPAAAAAARQPTKQQIRRTVAIVLDDLSLQPEQLYYAKQAITRFIESNIEEGDLIAIFRTASGMSFLQQFTTDRRQLLAALGRTSFRSLNQVNSLAAIDRNPNEDSSDPTLAQMALEQRLRDEAASRERQDVITSGTLTTLQYVVRGLRELPGRKSVVLFSESVQLFDAPQSMFNPGMTSDMAMRPGAQGGARFRTAAALRNLTDLANRCSVVLYAIDPRGLQTLGFTPADRPPANPRAAIGALNQRVYDFNAAQGGMQEMADSTGGLFFGNTNDLTSALGAALADQEEYYLLSFEPDDQTFAKAQNASKFHQLEIRAKRPGLRLRYRKGFVGVPDADLFPPAQQAPLYSALMSPFRSAELPIKLTPLLRQVEVPPATDTAKDKKTPAARAALRSLLHLDASKFTYREEPAAADDRNQTPWQVANIEIATYLFDQDQKVIADSSRAHAIRLRGASLDLVLRQGLLQEFDLVIPKPGAYQLRAAVLDTASGLTGSSAHFLEVPDYTKRQLTSSDLVVSGDAWQENGSPWTSPALRVFAPGDKLNYLMMIYGAAGNPQPQLESQVVLYQNGRAVFRGAKRPLAPAAGFTPGSPLTLSGNLNLGKNSAPGDYTLEIAVRDAQAPKKSAYTVRAIDFEVR